MYRACLFCTSTLDANEDVEHMLIGRRLAFDAAKGRLWIVCRGCGRWNLTPLEERWEAIEECERLFRGTYARVSTDNIGLARLSSGLELIRIGAPLRPEFAAWRYGSHFGVRRRRSLAVSGAAVVGATVAGVAFGAMAPAIATVAIGMVAGSVLIPGVSIVPVLGSVAVKEYAQFERVVARVPDRGSFVVVRAKHLADIELDAPVNGDPKLMLPCDEGRATFSGVPAVHALGVLLAGANRGGASNAAVRTAVDRIDRAGDAMAFMWEASSLSTHRGTAVLSPLNAYRGLGAMRLSSAECLALEMAVHEEGERRAMHGELGALANAWRAAEEIAAICDDDLSPPRLYE